MPEGHLLRNGTSPIGPASVSLLLPSNRTSPTSHPISSPSSLDRRSGLYGSYLPYPFFFVLSLISLPGS